MIRLCAFADEADKMLDGQICALKRNNISLIELRGVDGTNVAELSEEQAVAYSARLREAGIKVWSIGSPIGKVDIDCDMEEYLGKVRHVCHLARIFNTDKIRMFSFYGAHEKEDEVISRLGAMVSVAGEEGVKLYHENEKKIFGDTLDRVLRIRERLPELGLIYDPANFIEVGEPAERTLDQLHSYADYFHVKDAIASTLEIVPAGCGDGRIAELVGRISPTDDKVLTLEPHLRTFAGFSALDDSALRNKYTYATAEEAFDTAVSALKEILKNQGYIEINGGFIRK